MCHTTSHYTVSHILFPKSPRWLPNMIQGLQLAWQDLPAAPDTLPAAGAPCRERSMRSNGHLRAGLRDFLLYLLPSARLLNNQIAAISLNRNASYFLCRKSAPSFRLSPVRHPVSRTHASNVSGPSCARSQSDSSHAPSNGRSSTPSSDHPGLLCPLGPQAPLLCLPLY